MKFQISTDGQLAYKALLSEQKLEKVLGTTTAEGQSYQEAEHTLGKKLVSIFFMAYMHESVHICHVDVPFLMQLPFSVSYPGNFVFGNNDCLYL